MSTADRIVDTELDIEVKDDEVIDELEPEVLEPEVTEDPEVPGETFEVPEKFKDKSIEDVIKSYTEVEKELGRKNNEVGELRKLADDFIRQQLSVADSPTSDAVKETNVDVDTLLEDPTKAINDVLDDNPRIKALEEQLHNAKIAEQKAGFEKKHGDWQDLLQSQDFQEWVTASPIRQKMLMEADQNYDYAMADEVFSLYKEVRGKVVEEAKEKAEAERKDKLKKASGEKANSGATSKKVYRRKDLIRMKIEDPQRYAAMESEILKAYQEKRVR